MNYLYTLLLVFTIAYPLLKSFEDKIQFYKKFPSLFPSIIISAIVFIAWDMWFVGIGIWKFNPEYILGFYVYNLPLEECLFFFIIPFSCAFIYEVMNYFVKKDIFKNHYYFTLAFILLCLTIAALYHNRAYTLVVFLSLAIIFSVQLFVLKSNYLGKFYLSWLVTVIPFLIVDGIVTGAPIVIYDDVQNMGIRIGSIPLEDLFYWMVHFILIISIYESLQKRKNQV
jgi:lycopene cyclase domain-containing protein